DDDEISEEDHRSDDPERQVQVSTLIRDDRAFFYDGWIRPGIKKMRSEQDRKKQNRRVGNDSGAGLKNAPGHDPPGTARKILQHENAERAERKADEDKIAEQVRMEELLGRNKKRRKHKRHEADDGCDQAIAARPFKKSGRCWISSGCHVILISVLGPAAHPQCSHSGYTEARECRQ